MRLFLFSLPMFVAVACGCAKHSPVKKNYETIVTNPKRDTVKAKQLNEKGIEALSRGKREKAEEFFKEALVCDIDFGPAHNNLGRIYYEQGNNYLAAWEFEYAIKVMPGRYEGYNNLGMVLEQVGKLDLAITAYESAWKLAPANAEVLGNLCRARWRQDNNDPALAHLLEQLVFVETRPEWVHWAQERLACGKYDPPASRRPEFTLPDAGQTPVTPPLPPPWLQQVEGDDQPLTPPFPSPAFPPAPHSPPSSIDFSTL